ncbi:hypothetical protein B0H13DRAFT_1531158, partial [Mycena leptocephala]
RGTADRQMRERFDHLVDNLVIPELVGLSAIGSRFAMYKYDRTTQELTPPAAEIARNPSIVNDTTPETRWAHDFLDRGVGEAKLLQAVQSIRATAARCGDELNLVVLVSSLFLP